LISTVISTFALFLSLVLAASPPRDVELIYPADTANLNQNVSLGYQDPKMTETLFGLSRNVSISVTYPNGTHSPLVSTFSPDTFCTVGPTTGFVSGTFTVNQTGTYTAFWNYSYGISSDPSQANASYCGPPPFTYQSFLLNHTFEVQDIGADASVNPTTASSELPTQPTGTLNTSGGTRLESILWRVVTGAVIMALMRF